MRVISILVFLIMAGCHTPPEEPPVIFKSPVDPHKTEKEADLAHSGIRRIIAVVPCSQAQRHSELMATTGRFEHSSMEELCKGGYGVCRENICWVYGDATWEQAYQEWDQSPGHAENMKHGGKFVGFGRAFNGTHTYFVVIYTTKDPYFRDGF